MLRRWKSAGDRLIDCLDANQQIYKKELGRLLMCSKGLGLTEVLGAFTGMPLGATFFRGKAPIDGIWASPNIVVV